MPKSGMTYHASLHVPADRQVPQEEAHVLSGMVNGAIRAAAHTSI